MNPIPSFPHTPDLTPGVLRLMAASAYQPAPRPPWDESALLRRALELRERVAASDWNFEIPFGMDFYKGYALRPAPLTRALGSELTLACFRLLNPHFRCLGAADDVRVYSELPEGFPAFLGGPGPAERLPTRHSWTRDLFLTKHHSYTHANGMVIGTAVSEAAFLAYFAARQECILDPGVPRRWEVLLDQSMGEGELAWMGR